MDSSSLKVSIAGASGYLGRYLTRECSARGFDTTVILRNKLQFHDVPDNVKRVEAQVTEPTTLHNQFSNIDVVISALGITRQKDGLTYMDVDYQANVNLIDEAKRCGVKKFVYVSVFNGKKFQHTKICQAKEKLVAYLKASGLDFTIIRPNGFFSDMEEFLTMAKRGRIYLFGDGNRTLNPIHGSDLAKVIVDNIHLPNEEINIGGPDLLSQNDIANFAFDAINQPKKITHIPDWVRIVALFGLKNFTPSTFYGPLEFFLTTMVTDMDAPRYGSCHLREYFAEKVGSN